MQMVEMASAKFVCIVDDTKLVKGLGGSGGKAWGSLVYSKSVFILSSCSRYVCPGVDKAVTAGVEVMI